MEHEYGRAYNHRQPRVVMKIVPLSGFKKISIALKDPSEPRNMRLIAVATWRSLITVAFFLALASLYFGFFKFQTTLQTLQDAYAPAAASKAKFNRTTFDAMVSTFNDRQVYYRVVEAAPPTIADPSK